ncbi:hypothetical protein CISG_03912 [Coccidioides immitis RMSCC 3703]|uniref:Uncharacterized protein n=2 Tax=Coccidioides immitis TaxID=5501 RepID=A0A0J8QNC1_COCIT|nr:hypothetical protein CIRG_03085 [Coccidioides immitis RMSCC 2394]KMU73934.1 hypothetical protein CISG_03912 [Coccidioides immitis RMSCC 3703]
MSSTPFSVAFVPVHSQRRSDVRVSTVQFALLSLLDCTKISYAPLIYVMPPIDEHVWSTQKRQGFHRALLPRRCGHLGHRAEFTGADQRQAPTTAFLGNSGVLLHIPSVLQTDLTRWIDPLCGPSTNQGSSAGPSFPFFLALDLNTFLFFSRRRSMGDMQRRLSGCYDQYHEYPKAHNSSRPAIVVDELPALFFPLPSSPLSSPPPSPHRPRRFRKLH